MLNTFICLIGCYLYGYIQHCASARRWNEEDKKDHASLLRMRRTFKRGTK